MGGKCFYCGIQKEIHGKVDFSSGGINDVAVTNDDALIDETGDRSEIYAEKSIDTVGKDTRNVQPDKTGNENQLATTGMILAFCSFINILCSIPSFIVSIIALKRAHRSNGAGRSKAIVGLSISSILLTLYIVFIIFMLTHMSH